MNSPTSCLLIAGSVLLQQVAQTCGIDRECLGYTPWARLWHVIVKYAVITPLDTLTHLFKEDA
jgi:hypothetical protein